MGKVDLHINADLVAKAKAVGVSSVEAAAEDGLRRAIAEKTAATSDARADQWAIDNAQAIQDHRARIAEGGIFGEDLRAW